MFLSLTLNIFGTLFCWWSWWCYYCWIQTNKCCWAWKIIVSDNKLQWEIYCPICQGNLLGYMFSFLFTQGCKRINFHESVWKSKDKSNPESYSIFCSYSFHINEMQCHWLFNGFAKFFKLLLKLFFPFSVII